MTTTDAENFAAYSCLAALADWFDSDDPDPNTYLVTEDPSHVVEFLFGQLIAVIEDLCEDTEVKPRDYIRALTSHLGF